MNVHVFSSDSVAKAAADALNSLFKAENGKEFLFLSSGGSALSILEHVDAGNFCANSTIGVLDDRYSADPTVSNLAQLEKTDFYKKAMKNGAHYIDTKVQIDESMESLAQRFEQQLRTWMAENKGTIIATAGIGADGHTSGIMPFPEDPIFFRQMFDDKNRLVAAYDATGKNPYPMRVTTTLPFLRIVNSAIVFMPGEEKKAALEKLLAEDGTLAESPCRIWREIRNAQVFTD